MRSFLIVLSLVALPGCSAIHKALFEKDLSSLPVKRLEAQTLTHAAFCPGATVPLIVIATLEDGKEERTTGAGGGDISWDGLTVQSSGATVLGEGGHVQLPSEPHLFLNQPHSVTVSAKSNGSIQHTLPLPITLACPYAVNFSGASGRAGAHGEHGQAGAEGKSEISTGSHARAGGHGQAGGHGGNGRGGEAGRQGDPVELQVTLAAFSTPEKPYLEVHARNGVDGKSQLFLVNPSGGRVTVRANGGAGGRGGNGGNGAAGGRGGTGAPHGNGGDGGNGGEGGDGADGADGGRIRVHFDPAAKPFLGVLVLENRGGAGGSGGSAGPAGSGGNTFSGAQPGRAGKPGKISGRFGRAGRDGPAPEFIEMPIPPSGFTATALP